MIKRLDIGDIIGNIYGEPIKSELRYRKISRYLNRYMEIAKPEEPVQRINENVKLDKTIWVCWLQGIDRAPSLVKKCYEALVKNKPEGFEIILLTSENIHDFVTFPHYIMDKYSKGIINHTHFSDILRTELLVNYGGCWVDATVFCSEKIPKYMVEGNMFVYKWSTFDKSVLKISSWWMYSKNRFILMEEVRSVLYNYWRNENRLIEYFLFHIIFSKVVDRNSFNQMLFKEIPYANNSNPHSLQGQLVFEYNEDRWNIMKGLSPVHKLTYKRKYLQGDIYNFYMALMQDVLG